MNLLLPFFPLTSTFFGLNYSYRKPFLEEIWACSEYLNIPYDVLMKMPTDVRKFFIFKHTEKINKQIERYDEVKATQVTKTFKHSRTTTVSGEGVKNYSGKI